MERGFIQGEMQIKFLLLYILSRADAPINLDVLTDVALCDDGVGYFDFAAALSELIASEHVSLEDGQYAITEKGRRDGSAVEDQLPYSVCLRCDQKLAEINDRIRRDRRIHADCFQNLSGSWRLELALDGEEENQFTLGLTVSRKEDAQALIRRFRSDPQGFFRILSDMSDALHG